MKISSVNAKLSDSFVQVSGLKISDSLSSKCQHDAPEHTHPHTHTHLYVIYWDSPTDDFLYWANQRF